jgi:hypothetical protein
MAENIYDMQQCIQNCRDCQRACMHTLAHTLNQCDAANARLLIDCAEICQVSANFMLRESESHGYTCAVCAQVCERCADACEKMEDPQMKLCGEICRRCADSCHYMADSMST